MLPGPINRIFLCVRTLANDVKICLLLLGVLCALLYQQAPVFWSLVTAAESTVASDADAQETAHTIAGFASVFTDDQTGYKFYKASNNQCYFVKSTDGGVTWGTQTLVNSFTDCSAMVVWYDGWTPGDNGTNIHIISLHPNTAREDLRYNRLDTTSDTLLAATTGVDATNGVTMTLSAGANKPAITKGGDGTIYIAMSDDQAAFVRECSASCDLTTSWSSTGSNPLDQQNADFNLLVPMDNDEIMLINRDRTANDIRSKVWDGSAWSSSWTLIDPSAAENSVWDVAMAAVYNPAEDEIYLAYISDHNNFTVADHDIRTAKFNGTSWSNTADLTTNDTRGLTTLSLAVDENTNDVYIAFAARTTITDELTTNVYWASSTNAMTTWGTEQGPLNVGADNMYGVDTNYLSDQRLYVSWFENGPDDIYGDTILDTSPPLTVSATGTQIASLRASSSDVYLGGTFVFQEFQSSRNVTDITITETGSVDAGNDLTNIRLQYDFDTTAPYTCDDVSYNSGDAQFGLTDTNGFSGANGVSSFTDSVSVGTSSSLCLYVVLDVLATAADGQAVAVEINNPSVDVQVTGTDPAKPNTTVTLGGSSSIENSQLNQTGYHWRNDDGTESSASSATGGTENTALAGLTRDTPRRIRLSVNNTGSTSTLPSTLQLEYGEQMTTCAAISSWTAVGTTDDDWNMFDSANLTNGADTTNVLVTGGGVTDSDTLFKSPNGGVRDTTDSLTSLALDDPEFIEVEFSITASTSAVAGTSYCFRLTENGEPLNSYTEYPQVTLAADVIVSALGIQTATVDIPQASAYTGGTFVIAEGAGSRDLTSITITENGSIDASSALADVELYYDLDTSAPYDCVSESYGGSEAQFGATVASFSGANGTASFADSVTIATSSTACVYVVFDVTTSAQNGNEIEIQLDDPSSNISVSGGASISPTTAVVLDGTTTVIGSIVTQVHYHWRNDDGNETGATSATGGSEDTVLTDVEKNEPFRLRIGLSNEGSTTSIPRRYGLEFGIKATTCNVVSSWTDVGAFTNDAFDMFDSTFVTNGETTTDIAVANGGVSDEESFFLGSNAGVRDTDSFSATTTLSDTQYVDLEYSIRTTGTTPFDTTYCFRLTEDGTPLVAYDVYPELTTTVKRDFKIQRGTTSVSGTSQTLTAGVDYDAPASSTNAFVRITNPHHNGAGNNTGANQNPDDVTVYITGATDLTSSFTFTRDTDSINETYVAWEIIEFIGDPGTDNEFVVRDVGTLTQGATVASSTGSAVSDITDDADVMVFITGARMTNGTRSNFPNSRVTSDWVAATDQPLFERDATNQQVAISYAVVEFTGLNWQIQRVEHEFVAAGVTETESITAVNSPNRAFVEVQKRMSLQGTLANFGVQAYVSSMGAVSFYLDPGATNPSEHTAVVWVIENTQTGPGEMTVYRSNGLTAGGPEPSVSRVTYDAIGIADISNASLFSSATQNQTTTNFPRSHAGITLTSSTTYDVWRSDTGGTLAYRVAVVEWPAADVVIRQNDYWWYVNTNALTPTDPWPAGAADVGENASITELDGPIADGEVIRLRQNFLITNGTLAASLATLKLQYGLRSTTCSAIASWTDVGAVGSAAIWRGFDNGAITDGVAVGGNPPGVGETVLTDTDRSGSYVESTPAAANPFSVNADENMEYDWVIQHNGAVQRSNYCFRAVTDDGNELAGYTEYPQLRTEGYAPVQSSWQWFDDEYNVTPTTTLAAEDVAPTEVAKSNTIKLRVTIDEVNNLEQMNARFKLQFSDSSDFTTATDVANTGSCTVDSIWCYADGAGVDNATITAAVLSTSDSCVAGSGTGCGVHNESSLTLTGFTHPAFAAIENEFTIQYQNISGYYGQVWYFRLYDVANGEAVPLDTGATYPSLTGESGSITFSIAGLPASTVTEGITTGVQTTATSVPFGIVPVNTDVAAAQRLTVTTNAVSGYQVSKFVRQLLQANGGEIITTATGTNAVPVTWGTACAATSSCFAYHAGDDTLSQNAARFASDDTYASFDTAAAEIMYSEVPTGDTEDIIYRIRVNGTQAAGEYSTNVVYIATPVF